MDAHAEAAGKAALKKAESEYLSMRYAAAAAHLDKAVHACPAGKCSDPTRAALMRDLGTMLFRDNKLAGATKAWTDAAHLQKDIEINPAYDAPDLRAAFDKALGRAAPPPKAVTFLHTPPGEQKTNTPLPLYVTGGGDAVVGVTVTYRSDDAEPWKHLELKKTGDGWGGLIPCGDVKAGTISYYVQGFDAKKKTVATAGDEAAPLSVSIKDTITAEAPHLPDQPAPKTCAGAAKARHAEKAAKAEKASEAAEGGEATEEKPAAKEASAEEEHPAHRLRRVWIGLAGEFDFQPVPGGQDLCHRANNGLPTNSGNLYCTLANGNDFPTQQTNGSLYQTGTVPPGAAMGSSNPYGAGNTNGGVVPANLRLVASVDVAATSNLMIGVRGGLVFFTYPGQDAVTAGKSSSLGRLHLELRGTWVFGQDALTQVGIRPMVFLGGGVSQFSAHVGSTATLWQGSPPTPSSGPVNIWSTTGPEFVMLGAGGRWAVVDAFAVTLAARLNLAFGGNGLIPAFGPELGVQYGF